MLLYDDSTIDDLFYCAPAWSQTCLGLESVEDDSEHDLAGTADCADGAIVLTLLEVAFLW